MVMSRVANPDLMCYTSPMSMSFLKCNRCTMITISVGSKYEHKHGITCSVCIRKHIEADGRIVIERDGDWVKIFVVFDESIFAEHCYRDQMLPPAMAMCGYKELTAERWIDGIGVRYDTVLIAYEPPIIRALRGRKPLAEVIESVRGLLTRRKSVM